MFNLRKAKFKYLSGSRVHLMAITFFMSACTNHGKHNKLISCNVDLFVTTTFRNIISLAKKSSLLKEDLLILKQFIFFLQLG